MEKGRGVLTPEIKKCSKSLLEYEINEGELRLMVYIQYRITNEQTIDRKHTSSKDRLILTEWIKKGYLNWDDMPNFTITKKFWDIICEIIFMGYVDYS